MCKILIFAGTTEGRELARFCEERGVSACVSVATEYGAQKLSGVKIISGALTEAEMLRFMTKNAVSLVFDATHPYAVEASENILRACERAGARLYRVIREKTAEEREAEYFDTYEEIVSRLLGTQDPIFITTGSKNLDKFCALPNYRARCAVRVLPSGLERCERLGFDTARVITGTGPFTKAENIGHMKKFGARYLVTKDSGRAGGFAEKLAAARELKIKALVLTRPAEDGISVSEAEKILGSFE